MFINYSHLTYCTNIHSGETWKEIFENLKKYIPEIKPHIAPKQLFGIGLRLSNIASEELCEAPRIEEFKKWLIKNECYVFTINGFPYGNFHHQKVKDNVHLPDWSNSLRFDYTKRLIHILEQLLPQGVSGGISTSPISYKPWFLGNLATDENIYNSASNYLISLVFELHQIEKIKNKIIHLDIEPEPDGLIENTKELIDFFNNFLLKSGAEQLSKLLNTSIAESKSIILKHIQVCYDICHFAIAYEKPIEVYQMLQENNIKIGKIQISAALKTNIPSNIEDRNKIKTSLLPFVESTYLHQVSALLPNGKIYQYRDLPDALAQLPNTEEIEWKTHFHVPIFIKEYGILSSTQNEIKEVLELQKKEQISEHLEIETYTWEVLPENLKISIEESIIREYLWVINNL
ncbi:MAG: xylose isomerase [Cytophagales bacterium]|nr:MAG: xylose isomerase [Cytophagales bacterium]